MNNWFNKKIGIFLVVTNVVLLITIFYISSLIKTEIKVSLAELILAVFNVIIVIVGVYQLVTSKKEEENTKGKVRAWQNQAEGLKNALLNISYNSKGYSEKDDVIEAITAISQIAVSLDKSFIEERFYNDAEIKVQREKRDEETKKLFSVSTSSSFNPRKIN